MDVKSLIQGMLSPTKDDLCAVMLATNANGACQGQREEIEIGDRQVNRMRKGGLWKFCRENTKTFPNVTFGMIPDSVAQMLAGTHLYFTRQIDGILHNIFIYHFGGIPRTDAVSVWVESLELMLCQFGWNPSN